MCKDLQWFATIVNAEIGTQLTLTPGGSCKIRRIKGMHLIIARSPWSVGSFRRERSH